MSNEQTTTPDLSLELQNIQQSLNHIQILLAKVVMLPKPEWMTVKDYARYVGKTTRTVDRWISEDKVVWSYNAGVKMIKLPT